MLYEVITEGLEPVLSGQVLHAVSGQGFQFGVAVDDGAVKVNGHHDAVAQLHDGVVVVLKIHRTIPIGRIRRFCRVV